MSAEGGGVCAVVAGLAVDVFESAASPSQEDDDIVSDKAAAAAVRTYESTMTMRAPPPSGGGGAVKVTPNLPHPDSASGRGGFVLVLLPLVAYGFYLLQKLWWNAIKSQKPRLGRGMVMDGGGGYRTAKSRMSRGRHTQPPLKLPPRSSGGVAVSGDVSVHAAAAAAAGSMAVRSDPSSPMVPMLQAIVGGGIATVVEGESSPVSTPGSPMSLSQGFRSGSPQQQQVRRRESSRSKSRTRGGHGVVRVHASMPSETVDESAAGRQGRVSWSSRALLLQQHQQQQQQELDVAEEFLAAPEEPVAVVQDLQAELVPPPPPPAPAAAVIVPAMNSLQPPPPQIVVSPSSSVGSDNDSSSSVSAEPTTVQKRQSLFRKLVTRSPGAGSAAGTGATTSTTTTPTKEDPAKVKPAKKMKKMAAKAAAESADENPGVVTSGASLGVVVADALMVEPVVQQSPTTPKRFWLRSQTASSNSSPHSNQSVEQQQMMTTDDLTTTHSTSTTSSATAAVVVASATPPKSRFWMRSSSNPTPPMSLLVPTLSPPEVGNNRRGSDESHQLSITFDHPSESSSTDGSLRAAAAAAAGELLGRVASVRSNDQQQQQQQLISIASSSSSPPVTLLSVAHPPTPAATPPSSSSVMRFWPLKGYASSSTSVVGGGPGHDSDDPVAATNAAGGTTAEPPAAAAFKEKGKRRLRAGRQSGSKVDLPAPLNIAAAGIGTADDSAPILPPPHAAAVAEKEKESTGSNLSRFFSKLGGGGGGNGGSTYASAVKSSDELRDSRSAGEEDDEHVLSTGNSRNGKQALRGASNDGGGGETSAGWFWTKRNSSGNAAVRISADQGVGAALDVAAAAMELEDEGGGDMRAHLQRPRRKMSWKGPLTLPVNDTVAPLEKSAPLSPTISLSARFPWLPIRSTSTSSAPPPQQQQVSVSAVDDGIELLASGRKLRATAAANAAASSSLSGKSVGTEENASVLTSTDSAAKMSLDQQHQQQLPSSLNTVRLSANSNDPRQAQYLSPPHSSPSYSLTVPVTESPDHSANEYDNDGHSNTGTDVQVPTKSKRRRNRRSRRRNHHVYVDPEILNGGDEPLFIQSIHRSRPPYPNMPSRGGGGGAGRMDPHMYHHPQQYRGFTPHPSNNSSHYGGASAYYNQPVRDVRQVPEYDDLLSEDYDSPIPFPRRSSAEMRAMMHRRSLHAYHPHSNQSPSGPGGDMYYGEYPHPSRFWQQPPSDWYPPAHISLQSPTNPYHHYASYRASNSNSIYEQDHHQRHALGPDVRSLDSYSWDEHSRRRSIDSMASSSGFSHASSSAPRSDMYSYSSYGGEPTSAAAAAAVRARMLAVRAGVVQQGQGQQPPTPPPLQQYPRNDSPMSLQHPQRPSTRTSLRLQNQESNSSLRSFLNDARSSSPSLYSPFFSGFEIPLSSNKNSGSHASAENGGHQLQEALVPGRDSHAVSTATSLLLQALMGSSGASSAGAGVASTNSLPSSPLIKVSRYDDDGEDEEIVFPGGFPTTWDGGSRRPSLLSTSAVSATEEFEMAVDEGDAESEGGGEEEETGEAAASERRRQFSLFDKVLEFRG